MRVVSVPATSANLGGAFDCAALALDLHLEVEPAPLAKPGFEVVCGGPEGASIPRDSSNLVLRGINRVAAWSGTPVPGLRLQIRSEIPVGVGLGSSAAAIVAGLLIGLQFSPTRPDDATLIGLAAELEGHPDNVAAAYLGGLVVSAPTAALGPVLSRKAHIPSDLDFIVVIPELSLSTSEARAVVPDSFSREDAVHNLQRTALLVASAFSGEFDLHPELFADRWHQAQRAALLPGVTECLSVQHPDLLGVFLSGAGPSVLAVSRQSAWAIADVLLGRFRSRGVGARAVVLKSDNAGAKGRLEWKEVQG
jgi:homoserine kinase